MEMDSNSLTTENPDVDKSLFDAEQFLSNFTTLRDECERLKAENHELQLQIQQANQDRTQLQIDKQNLERHIQKEALRQKEVVWNLKIEVQKSQEERLAWKEKFLDLCIKSSQSDTVRSNNVVLGGSEKKGAKKMRTRKPTRRKVKVEQGESNEFQVLPPEDHNLSSDATIEFTRQEPEQQQPQQQQQNPGPIVSEPVMEVQQVGESSQSEIECGSDLVSCSTNTTAVTHEVTLPSETLKNTNINLDGKFEASPDISHTNIASTTSPSNYYSIQPAQFDLDSQGPSGNTTTFILQTQDATFCATAIMDDQQRAHFNNVTSVETIPFEIKTNSPATFSNEPSNSFSGPIITKYNSDTDSEENTEFNFRCTMCNFTYSEQAGLDKHIRAKHSAKTNVCKECGKGYSTK